MEIKSFYGSVKAASRSGEGQLVVATLNTVDKDGDVTLPGFFGRQTVQLVPAHDWTHVPIGKGVIFERGDEALVDFKLNLDIPAARDWHAAIKFDLDNPPALQEYSYGFQVKKGGSSRGEFAGRQVQFLRPLADGSPGVTVFEVSPCLRGAGVRTRTVSLDGDTGKGLQADITDEYLKFVANCNGIRVEDPKVTLARIYRRNVLDMARANTRRGTR